jgi:hypothetical protein
MSSFLTAEAKYIEWNASGIIMDLMEEQMGRSFTGTGISSYLQEASHSQLVQQSSHLLLLQKRYIAVEV